MRITKYIILFQFLLFGFSIANSIENLIKLDVYNGNTSIMLNWNLNDSISVKKISLFSKSANMLEYQYLYDLNANDNRYSFKDCNGNNRTFFMIQVEDSNGKIYISDKENSPFGTCLNNEDIKKFNEVEDLFALKIENRLKLEFPYFESIVSKSIAKMLLTDISEKHLWINFFPLGHLSLIKLHLESLKDFLKNMSDSKEFYYIASIYSTQFMMTPDEFNDKLSIVISLIKSNSQFILETFNEDLDLINSFPPIIISNINSKFDNTISVQIFDINYISTRNISVNYIDEQIDVYLKPDISIGDKYIIQIPEYWTKFSLELDNVVIQKHFVIKGQNNKISPFMDIFEENKHNENLNMYPSQDLYLNEISWNSDDSELSIELSRNIDSDIHDMEYFLNIDGQKVWSISPNSYNLTSFYDSTFNLHPNPKGHILKLYSSSTKRFNSIETIYLHDSLDININRYPDRKNWEKTFNNSIGRANKKSTKTSENLLIPEIFVLYQNYPNPFNNNTRITFDLIQDAIVSLYITDATGRVKTSFSDNQFYVSGKYSFDWSGENFSTGIYFFTITSQADGYSPITFSRKMIYLK